MTNGSRHREIVIKEDFSSDTIRIMFVDELLNWFRAAEEAETALVALTERPKDGEGRNAFKEATQAFVEYSTGWIELQAAEKAPDADIPSQMREIKKLFQRVDFLLIPDTTLPEEQALSGVRARLRGQAEKIDTALNRFANTIQGIVRPSLPR